jgi:hypothetical protein
MTRHSVVVQSKYTQQRREMSTSAKKPAAKKAPAKKKAAPAKKAASPKKVAPATARPEELAKGTFATSAPAPAPVASSWTSAPTKKKSLLKRLFGGK